MRGANEHIQSVNIINSHESHFMDDKKISSFSFKMKCAEELIPKYV